jgi:hypothetical protein
VDAAYDHVAQTVSQGTLAEGRAHAFNSNETPPFEQMVSGLHGQSSPDQKAGLINQILGAIGGVGSLSKLAAFLSGGSVTPQQAEQIPPDAVQVLAQHAAKQQPSIVDAAASFYAQHSTLVKTIGAGALALLMHKISQSRS